jgi:hypothetical protein
MRRLGGVRFFTSHEELQRMKGEAHMIRRMLVLGAVACAAVVQTAQASPISGSENLSSSPVKIAGTKYTFSLGNDKNEAVSVGASGDLSPFGLGTIAHTSGALDSSSVAGWSITETVGGTTATFITATAFSIVNGPQGNLDLLGVLMVTGKTPTAAELDIGLATTSKGVTSATFSLSSLFAVPEPSTMALMGIGTVGVLGAGFRRKRNG